MADGEPERILPTTLVPNHIDSFPLIILSSLHPPPLGPRGFGKGKTRIRDGDRRVRLVLADAIYMIHHTWSPIRTPNSKRLIWARSISAHPPCAATCGFQVPQGPMQVGEDGGIGTWTALATPALRFGSAMKLYRNVRLFLMLDYSTRLDSGRPESERLIKSKAVIATDAIRYRS